MTSVVGASAVSRYNAFFSSTANWLADTFTAIQNQQNQGGLLGMLQNSGGDGSIRSFLSQSSTTANNFALISQNSVTNASSLYAQIASQNIQEQNAKKLQDALEALSATQQQIQPKNVLDPIIFFENGSTLDTNSNILTLSDGTQIDTMIGTKVIDSASIMQLGNGAYLDTKNNILTMADGTQIDTVTGLKISVTA